MTTSNIKCFELKRATVVNKQKKGGGEKTVLRVSNVESVSLHRNSLAVFIIRVQSSLSALQEKKPYSALLAAQPGICSFSR